MKNFLTSVKGKVIAGAATVGVVGAIIVAVVIMNSGYRTIAVDGMTGITNILNAGKTSEAYIGQHLKSGDDVTVTDSSDLTLALDTDKYVYAEEKTHFWIEAEGKKDDARTKIHLADGSNLCRIDNKLKDTEAFEVDTPNATMSVRGTVFQSTYSTDVDGYNYTQIDVFEGQVFVEAKYESGQYTKESRILTAGESALIRSNDEISEFVIDENDVDENGNPTAEGDKAGIRKINYKAIKQNTAKKLAEAIDAGRDLSIGKELLFDYVALTEHRFKKQGEEVEATCTEDGYYEEICEICGEVGEHVTQEKLGHLFEKTAVTDESTGKQVEKMICSRCGLEEKSRSIADKDDDDELKDDDITDDGDDKKPDGDDGDDGNKDGKKKDTTDDDKKPDDKDPQKDKKKDGEIKKTTSVDPTPGGGDDGGDKGGGNGGDDKGGDSGQPADDNPCAAGHSFSTNQKDATCTAAGAITKVCKVCGYKETNPIKALGHDYKETTTDPTCTTAGKKVNACTRCNDVESETPIAALGHDYKETTTDPTCTLAGKKVNACTRCNDIESETPIAALGHDNTETTVDPTCEKAGKKIETCKRCNGATETPIAALGHNYAEDVSKRVEPSCENAGKKFSTCNHANCENPNKEEPITALGHDYVEDATRDVPADCTHMGQKFSACSRAGCGATKTEDDAAKPALGHSYDTVWVMAHSNETVHGKECLRCAEVYTENHSISYTASAAASMHQKTCSQCAYFRGVAYEPCDFDSSIAANVSHDPAVDPNTHQIKCSKCSNTKTEGHIGNANEECTVCHAIIPVA